MFLKTHSIINTNQYFNCVNSNLFARTAPIESDHVHNIKLFKVIPSEMAQISFGMHRRVLAMTPSCQLCFSEVSCGKLSCSGHDHKAKRLRENKYDIKITPALISSGGEYVVSPNVQQQQRSDCSQLPFISR